MQFRLLAIALFVAVVACASDQADARSLSLGQSFAMLHQVAYPQSDFAMRFKFGRPYSKTAIGRTNYRAYGGGFISCGRSGGKVTGCDYEGR